MSLTKQHFIELAEIIATTHSMTELNSMTPNKLAQYVEHRLFFFCKTHGHNFNEKTFKDAILKQRNLLNDESEN